MQVPEVLAGLRRAVSALRPLHHPSPFPRRGRYQPSVPGRAPKHFSSASARLQGTIQAAPEIDLSKSSHETPLNQRVRIAPASSSYFTGHPAFTDDLLSLQAVLRKYQTYPVVTPAQAPRVAWKKLEEYRRMVGGMPVRSAKYAQLVVILRRLNQIHPSLVPDEVRQVLEKFKRDIQPNENVAKPHFVDEFGRSLGVGRRKTSTARAWLVEGAGEVLVNGKSLTQVFGRQHDRESAIWALKATDRVDKYNVFGLVRGGGVTGQAEALTLAITKALLVQEPALKPALRRAGVVTRDPRKVERKKPGHLKARKKPAWVKR